MSPTNERKATPANGIGASAVSTRSRRVGSDGHAPASSGLAGIASRIVTSEIARGQKNTMPGLDDHDHLITDDERLRVAMAIQ